jgi:hypothetical protein
MNSFRTSILSILTLFSGFGLGWLANDQFGAPPAAGSAPATASPSLPATKATVVIPDAFATALSASQATDPPGASEAARRCFAALQAPDPERRFASFLLALDDVSAADVSVIFAKIKADDKLGRGVVKEFDSLIQKWGELDHTAALEFAKSHDTASAKAWGYGMALRGWARKDPQAAVAWLNEQLDMPKWDEVAGGLLKGVNEKDPKLAGETLNQTEIQVDWVRNQVVELVADGLVRQGGAKAARKWYDTVPMESDTQHKLKAAAMREAVKYIAKASVPDAAAWLLEQPSVPWRPEEPFKLVAEETAKTDPAGALTWLAKASPGKNTMAAGVAREIYQELAKASPEKAAAWVAEQKDREFLKKVTGR